MTNQSHSRHGLSVSHLLARLARTAGPPVAFLLIVLLLWQFAVPAMGIKPYLIPTPTDIASEISRDPTDLLFHTGVTLLESALGFLVACLIGFGTAVVFVHCKTAEKLAYPYVVAFKAIPLIAMAPLLIVWFGNGLSAKVIMSAMICFFPIVVSTTVGLRDVSSASLDLMHSLSASRWQILMMVRLPSAGPHIFAALKVASTLSVIGAIVAELTGADRGLGYLIVVSSYRMETAALFAAILASALAGVSLFGIISLAEKRLLSWHQAFREA